MNESHARWDALTKRIVALILLLVLTLIVYRFRALLSPLLVAFLIAFILDPLVDFLESRLRMSRALAAVLVFALLILLVAAAAALAVPPAVKAIRSLNLDFVQIAADLERLIARPVVILNYELDLRSLYQQLRETLQSFVSTVAKGTVDFVFGFASTVFWLVIILLSAFYLVKDADRITAWLDSLPPPGIRDDFVRLRQQITDVWNAFLRGQLLMALAMAAIGTTAAAIVGLPNPLALGILTGAMEFVPSLGPVIAAVPAVLLALFQGSSWIPLGNFWFAVLVLGVYIGIQQIENYVLIPRIMGQSLNLHPIVVLLAIVAGGSLAGILGVLVAAPMVATLRVLGTYIYRRLTDQDPFPETEAKKPRAWLGKRLLNRLRRRLWARQWVVRPARPADKAGMEAICAKIWEGHDYVPKVWDEWLADRHGELTVVERKGRIVALGKLTRLADDEWWLEGLRVDPAYRGLGVAQLLQAHQIEVAERLGKGVLRLGTASDNYAVHHNIARDGFRRVAIFHYCGADALPGSCPLQPLGRRDLKRVWQLIEHSTALERAGGLYEVSWQWMRLTPERLAAHLANKEVWGSKVDDRLAAVAIVPRLDREEQQRLVVGYIGGEPAAVTALAWGLRILAGQQGLQGVRIKPPDDPALLQALEAAGVQREDDFSLWIFERPLAGNEKLEATCDTR